MPAASLEHALALAEVLGCPTAETLEHLERGARR
jgi:hypothetical protein